MRRSLLTFLPLGTWLAACSTPAPAPDNEALAPPEAVPVLAAPPSQAAVTSALEAGHDHGLELARKTESKGTARRSVPRPAPATAPQAVAALELAVPEVSGPATAPSLAAAPGSMPMASLPARSVDTATNIGRGPMILIRGGIAGPRDNCALHGPGRMGPGIAINSRAPVMGNGGMGGGVLVNERAPRSGGYGRPRGIR